MSSDRPKKNHWFSLASEIGAEVPPEPEESTAAPAVPIEEPPPASPPVMPPPVIQMPDGDVANRPKPAAKPPADWASLAASLGLAPDPADEVPSANAAFLEELPPHEASGAYAPSRDDQPPTRDATAESSTERTAADSFASSERADEFDRPERLGATRDVAEEEAERDARRRRRGRRGRRRVVDEGAGAAESAAEGESDANEPSGIEAEFGLRDIDPRDIDPRDIDPRDIDPREQGPRRSRRRGRRGRRPGARENRPQDRERGGVGTGGPDARDIDARDIDPRDIDPRDIDPRDVDPRGGADQIGWNAGAGYASSFTTDDADVPVEFGDESSTGGRASGAGPREGGERSERGRRRRRRRRGSGTSENLPRGRDEAASSASVGESDAERPAEESGFDLDVYEGEDVPMDLPTGRVRAPELDEDDADDGDDAVHVNHRNIPSWEEAIGSIIAVNMEARARSPHGSQSRGRGGRGGGRAPRGGRGRGRDDRGGGRG